MVFSSHSSRGINVSSVIGSHTFGSGATLFTAEGRR